jgi:hypothetical protein
MKESPLPVVISAPPPAEFVRPGSDRRFFGSNLARDRYDLVARIFHWTTALMIAGLYLTNWARGASPRGSLERAWWLSAHESLGLLVLIISAEGSPPCAGQVTARTTTKIGSGCRAPSLENPQIHGLARRAPC